MQNPEPQFSQVYQSPLGTQTAAREAALAQAYDAAGGNFYTIAVFSLINSVINLLGLSIYFPVGLGLTLIIDGVAFALGAEAPESRGLFLTIGIVLDLLILGGVALFGFLIKKRAGWLIVIGAVLYLLDGLILLLFTDWVGAAFHVTKMRYKK
jgi:hypothetical protein